MRTLDRTAFRLSIPLLGASVPAARSKILLNAIEGTPISLPGIQRIQPHPSDPSRRLLLLNAPNAVIAALEAEHATLAPHTLELDYDYWNAHEILHAVLPEDLLENVPTSFSTVGHIAHLNLRDEYLPHRHLIAQVILDKNANIKTVVNKLDTIDHQFRFFKMEVLAGEDQLNVELVEQGLRYRFNFAEVYWNSRLSTEHARLVELFQPGELVVDAFAGVGPFALPAAKKGCFVFCSDLNPSSAASLRENVKLNKVCKNADGRAYIRSATIAAWDDPFEPPMPRAPPRTVKGKARAVTPALVEPPPRLVSHFVMNLPASAITMLDAFRGLYTPLRDRSGFDEAVATTQLPMVHCYCFAREKEVALSTPDICERAASSLGRPVGTDKTDDFSISFVRSVAPGSNMYRLSFRLPPDVVFAPVPPVNP